MDIDNSTPREKSVVLAKAIGRSPEHEQLIPMWMIRLPSVFSDDKELESVVFDLYEPANMALAKRAIAWGWQNISSYREWLSIPSVAVRVLVNRSGIEWGLDKLLVQILMKDLVTNE